MAIPLATHLKKLTLLISRSTETLTGALAVHMRHADSRQLADMILQLQAVSSDLAQTRETSKKTAAVPSQLGCDLLRTMWDVRSYTSAK